ncbi:MAG: hypothetical protein H7Z42_14680, partial [Roseiflexaceae bacterium]|nr:hypothetical protein [Roseiflexaceae bacterium]
MPKHYVRIPDQLLRAALHTPRVIAVYALVARTWLLRGEATPLSSQDITKFDPSFSRGAAQRALVWLIDHGWLVAARRPGLKSSLTPTWGTIRGEPRVWNAADSHAGRPPHVKTHTLDVRLFDLFMGRLIPFDGQRGARVTRYLSTPALTLDDVGSYALLMAGYGGGTTLQLEQHG